MKMIFSFSLTLVSLITFSQQIENTDSSMDEVFTIVAKSATYPGGFKAWGKYLKDNLQYPEEAMKKGIEGRVFVQYIVEKDGTGTEIEVVKGIGAGCDEEALRLIREMPKWVPGRDDNGEIVRQRYIQVILFASPNP